VAAACSVYPPWRANAFGVSAAFVPAGDDSGQSALNSVKERGSHGALRSQLITINSHLPHRCLAAFSGHVARPSRSIQTFNVRERRRDPIFLRYSSLLGQCLRWYHMPLEPCPTCGYALSVVDHHCRHCTTASRAIPSRHFNAKYLQQMIIMAVVALSVFVYLIFFR
jgi:hypothetical protein